MQQTIDEPRAKGGDAGHGGGIINLLGKGEGAVGAKTAVVVTAGTIIVTIGAVIIGAGARTTGAAMATSTTSIYSTCCM
jgi:hypothetical protein